MVRCKREGKRSIIGGIISLYEFSEAHKSAITFDLLTKTNYTLDDVGGALSWSALYSFIQNLGSDSALARDLGKSSGWENRVATNTILADIYDLLQVINANIVSFAGGKHKKITPYPRPGKDEDKKQTIGKDAIPVEDLREWIRRKQHGER